MERKQIAEEFIKGYDCSQVVVRNFCDRFGISEDEANRISAGFGGGMLLGAECGAFTGGLIVLGLRYGHSAPEGLLAQKDVMLARVAEFREKFEQEFGSLICKDMLGYDVSVPEQLQEALDSGRMLDYCPCVVEKAIRILEEMI